MRTILVVFFIIQTLAAAAIYGSAMHSAASSSGFFGRMYLPFPLQLVLPLWLAASLFLNVVFIAII